MSDTKAHDKEARAEKNDGKKGSDDKKGAKSKGSTAKKGSDKAGEAAKKIPVVVPSKDFELEKYVGRYQGHTKVTRLLFIAERYPEKQFLCHKLAVEELRKGRNTSSYRRLFENHPDILQRAGCTFDSAWADSVDKETALESEALEAELQNHKTNQDRKKIRSTHNKMGDLCYERGDFNGASRNYMRSAEHCLTPEHHLTLAKNSVKTSIAWGTFVQVHSYVEKAENLSLLNNKENVPLAAMFKVASGLAALESSRYAEAARKFSDASFEGVTTLNDIISVEDVAIYGCLCALAEFSREELRTLASDFHNFLEVVPSVSQMLHNFSTSNYASSLETLQVLKNDLQLDFHMHDHVERLYTKIRNKALKEYFQPYSSVDLEKMAKAFRTSVAELESELVELINNNQIQARIDSYNKCLVARNVTKRSQTYSRTIASGESLQTQSRAMLLRVSLTQNNMAVKPEKGFEKGRMAGMGGMGGMGMGGMGMAMMGMGGMGMGGMMQGRRN